MSPNTHYPQLFFPELSCPICLLFVVNKVPIMWLGPSKMRLKEEKNQLSKTYTIFQFVSILWIKTFMGWNKVKIYIVQSNDWGPVTQTVANSDWFCMTGSHYNLYVWHMYVMYNADAVTTAFKVRQENRRSRHTVWMRNQKDERLDPQTWNGTNSH